MMFFPLDVFVSEFSALLFIQGYLDDRTFTMVGLAALQPHNLINKICPVGANCPIQSVAAILAPTGLLAHDLTTLEQQNILSLKENMIYRENTVGKQGPYKV